MINTKLTEVSSKKKKNYAQCFDSSVSKSQKKYLSSLALKLISTEPHAHKTYILTYVRQQCKTLWKIKVHPLIWLLHLTSYLIALWRSRHNISVMYFVKAMVTLWCLFQPICFGWLFDDLIWAKLYWLGSSHLIWLWNTLLFRAVCALLWLPSSCGCKHAQVMSSPLPFMMVGMRHLCLCAVWFSPHMLLCFKARRL